MRNTCSIILAACIFTYSGKAVAAPVSLKKSQIAIITVSSKKITCGFVGSKWQVVKRTGAAKYSVNSKATAGQTTSCKQLLKPGSAKSLTQFPSAGSLVAAKRTSSGFGTQTLGRVGSRAVSGTPPTLGEIKASGSTNIFWRSGVVSSLADGSAGPDACNEFFGGQSDGVSGGYGACGMTEGVGYSVGQIVQSGTNICYMKNAATSAVAAGGGIEVVSGSLPGGDIRKLFSIPSGAAPRVIKVTAGEGGDATSMFIKVYSSSQNEANGDQYRFDFWACEGGQTPQEYANTRITSGGLVVTKNVNSSSGEGETRIGESTVQAFLRRSGNSLEFDTSRERTAVFSSTSGSDSYSSSVTVNGNNEIISKSRNEMGGDVRKSYSVTHFAGTGIKSLRFLEGAFKETSLYGSFQGGVEYRDSFYAAAPANTYVSQVSSADLSTDGFYANAPSLDTNFASYSCNANADITVTMDMETEAMQQVAEICEGERIDQMNFCQSAELQQAQMNYMTTCNGQ